MPKPRTPTNVLQLRGSDKKHPDRMRARANEPEVTEPLPDEPPDYLSPAEKRVWPEFVALIPSGVAKNCDRYIVELTVMLITQLKHSGLSAPKDLPDRLRRCLEQFGMTPAARSKVMAPKGKTNPFDQF